MFKILTFFTFYLQEGYISYQQSQQRFITMLSDRLKECEISSIVCEGYADVTIALTAVAYAENHPTTVIGEDTDLLVLLCYHASQASNRIIFSVGHSE